MIGVGNVFVISCVFFSLFLWHGTSASHFPFHFMAGLSFVCFCISPFVEGDFGFRISLSYVYWGFYGRGISGQIYVFLQKKSSRYQKVAVRIP